MDIYEGTQERLLDFLYEHIFYEGPEDYSLQELVILREHVNAAIIEAIGKRHGEGVTEIVKGNV